MEYSDDRSQIRMGKRGEAFCARRKYHTGHDPRLASILIPPQHPPNYPSNASPTVPPKPSSLDAYFLGYLFLNRYLRATHR